MIKWTQGTTIPDLQLGIVDDSGELYDFSQGWTFSLTIKGRTQNFTKTTSITGYEGNPNLIIVWATSNEIVNLASGIYSFVLTATYTPTGKIAKFKDTLLVEPA